MEFFLKPLTEVSSYIFLSGIFMIILGALIGITPPDSRKTLHTSLAIPLFIAVGLVYIFRSFDFLVEIGGLIKINSFLQGIVIFCGIELGRSNIENAFGKKPFSPWWYILLLLSLFYLNQEYNYTFRVIIAVMIMLAKLFAVVVTIKAAKILPDYNRISIQGGFSVAFFGAIIQLFNDLPFAYLVDGHYKPLEGSIINYYYLESFLFFIISIFIIFRRYAYEKSQRLHRLNTLSLISPVVVYLTSIIIALLVLIGSNMISSQERVKQNYESQSYNFNIKNAIKQRIDLAISSAHLFSQSPNLSKYLSKPDNNETREEVKKYLVSLNVKNPGISVFLSDSKGTILVSSEIEPIHEGQDISTRQSFINGFNGISSLSIYRENSEEKFGFYIDYPVLSDEKQILGVFIFKIELADLENLIKLNHYPTMIVDLNDNGHIMVANNKIFIDQNCGDIKQYIDRGIQPIDNIPILSMMTKHSAFFSLASFGDYPYGVLTLSNVDQSATTQVWLLFIALLVTFILYLVLYGIAYNSENMKTIESAQSNFQLIFNHTPEPICVIREDTNEILAVNKSMQNCFGYEESLVGKKIEDLIVESNQVEYKFRASADVTISECKFKKANDDVFTAEITASNIEYATNINAVLLNIHDISIFKVIEEKLTEAKNSAEEANQIKSRLLANASHELRTPMTAIIGLSELAVSICNNENQRRIVELLRISSKSLMSLINDMFNLSEIQNGKVDIKKSAFKLNDLIDETIEYVSFLAKRDNKNIVFRTINTLPENVFGDLDHIRQILLAMIYYFSVISVNNNTLVNIDFTEVNSESGLLVFIISGLNKERREEIEKSIDNDIDYADPYHASPTRKFASGISLYSMILKSLGGFVQVDDKAIIPETLSIRIVIPVELLDSNDTNVENITNQRYFYYNGKPLNLLVADDNDVNLFFVESVIKRFKGKCHSVRDGVEVLNALKEQSFDGILLDIQMPKMDGMKTLKEIRQMAGDISKIPVIAVSAFASEEEKNKILAAGAQKYLSKPFFPNDLYDAISFVFNLDKDIPVIEGNNVENEDNSNEKIEETTVKASSKKNTREDLISKLKRIDYNDFELRISPNSKSIVKLEEIYNRRYAALDIEVDNCINDNDCHRLRETAHSIKGLVGMISSNESWELAKNIEQKAAEGNMDEAVSKIGELRIHLTEISDDLKLIKEYLA